MYVAEVAVAEALDDVQPLAREVEDDAVEESGDRRGRDLVLVLGEHVLGAVAREAARRLAAMGRRRAARVRRGRQRRQRWTLRNANARNVAAAGMM